MPKVLATFTKCLGVSCELYVRRKDERVESNTALSRPNCSTLDLAWPHFRSNFAISA